MTNSRVYVFFRGSLYWSVAIFVILYFSIFAVRLFGYLYQGRIDEFDFVFQVLAVAQKSWVGIPSGMVIWIYAFFESGRHKSRRE